MLTIKYYCDILHAVTICSPKEEIIMNLKSFTLKADIAASTLGVLASYFFYHPIIPMVSSGIVLVLTSAASALFVFYVFRKNVAPMLGKREIPDSHAYTYYGALIPFYLFEVGLVIVITFFALIAVFLVYAFFSAALPHIPAIIGLLFN